MALTANNSRVFPRQFNHAYPSAARGEGAYLYDTAGKAYLDASGGAAVSCLGHGHPRVIAAIKAQLDKMAFAHTSFFTNDTAEELAQFLCDRAPAGFGRVYFLSGGSEANDTAMKLARQVHLERGNLDRSHYIARHQSYHGNTVGALSLCGYPARRAPFEPILLPNISHIAPCYAYRHQQDDESLEAYGLRAAGELEKEILRVGPDKVAAFFAETVVGSTLGAVCAAPGYFKEIRRICDKHGGRNRYGELLSSVFGGQRVEHLEEGRPMSRYRMNEMEFRFQTKAEEHFPVAVASMVSKYVREVAMLEFNAWWKQRLPDFKPTKGYPMDAARFLKDIKDELQRQQIPQETIWRCR